MKLAANIARSIKADLEAELRAVSVAVTAGVKDAGDGLKNELRKQVVSAGLGPRLARTWRSRAYPNKGHDAASLVWSKAPQIVRAFDQGVVLRGRDGLWLAIPTENAPKKGVGGKRISPSNFPEHRFGPLRFIYRRNGPSLLVVDGVRASHSRETGELRGFRKASTSVRRPPSRDGRKKPIGQTPPRSARWHKTPHRPFAGITGPSRARQAEGRLVSRRLPSDGRNRNRTGQGRRKSCNPNLAACGEPLCRPGGEETSRSRPGQPRGMNGDECFLPAQPINRPTQPSWMRRR